MKKLSIKSERSHLMSPFMTVTIKADLTGCFNPSQFATALNFLHDIHPLLSSTVQLDNSGQAYYITNTADNISFNILSDSCNWREYIKKENSKIFNLEEDCLLRIFILNSTNSFSIILFASHLLGDGLSLLQLLDDLLNIYAGMEVTAPKNFKLIESFSDFPAASKMSFLTKLYINTLNKSWRKNPRTFSLNDYYKLYKKYHQNHISDIKQLIFTPEETEKIIFSCKKNHLTINTAIVSSFISSFNKLNNLQVKTAVGINIRNDLTFNAEHFIGNYASCITFDYKWHNNLNFLENSNKISNLIQNKVYTPKLRLLLLNLFLTMDQTLIDSIYFSAFGDFDNNAAAKAAAIFYPKNSFPQIGTTNLGKSRLKTHYGNNTLNSISFIPPSSPANIMTIGAVTHNNKLNICIAYECSLITEEEVDSITTEAKRLLLNI